ncbi:uncharacterized protein V1510DRAFT_419599 [Dipodascopsis tothii]|uniref:uncharacterized protein n=1 Tax=Dipodascopsis tothii TaxID=44089 RepID=UPI0034CE621D
MYYAPNGRPAPGPMRGPAPPSAAVYRPPYAPGVGKPLGGQAHLMPQPHISEAAIHATQKVIPAMADHLENLAMAYDSELKDKEADLEQAHQLLENMRKEITTCEDTIRELYASAGGEQEQAHAVSQVAELEARMQARAEDLRRLVEKMQARELAKLVREQEHKLAAEPADGPDDVVALARELDSLQADRRRLVADIVELWAGAGVGEKINDYRRLLSLSSGLKVEEIDDMLDGISQALVGDTDVATVG